MMTSGLQGNQPYHPAYISPHQSSVSPHQHTVSPRHRDMSPRHREVSPRHREVSPRHRDLSPRHIEIPTRHNVLSPRHMEMSPYQMERSPHHRAMSPRYTDTQTHHRDMSTHHRDTSSMYRAQNIFDRFQSVPPASHTMQQSDAPLDLSNVQHGRDDQSPDRDMQYNMGYKSSRTSDSPLDLSCKTRKRSADTTDGNASDDDVICVGVSPPNKKPHSEAKRQNCESFRSTSVRERFVGNNPFAQVQDAYMGPLNQAQYGTAVSNITKNQINDSGAFTSGYPLNKVTRADRYVRTGNTEDKAHTSQPLRNFNHQGGHNTAASKGFHHGQKVDKYKSHKGSIPWNVPLGSSSSSKAQLSPAYVSPGSAKPHMNIIEHHGIPTHNLETENHKLQHIKHKVSPTSESHPSERHDPAKFKQHEAEHPHAKRDPTAFIPPGLIHYKYSTADTINPPNKTVYDKYQNNVQPEAQKEDLAKAKQIAEMLKMEASVQARTSKTPIHSRVSTGKHPNDNLGYYNSEHSDRPIRSTESPHRKTQRMDQPIKSNESPIRQAPSIKHQSESSIGSKKEYPDSDVNLSIGKAESDVSSTLTNTSSSADQKERNSSIFEMFNLPKQSMSSLSGNPERDHQNSLSQLQMMTATFSQTTTTTASLLYQKMQELRVPQRTLPAMYTSSRSPQKGNIVKECPTIDSTSPSFRDLTSKESSTYSDGNVSLANVSSSTVSSKPQAHHSGHLKESTLPYAVPRTGHSTSLSPNSHQSSMLLKVKEPIPYNVATSIPSSSTTSSTSPDTSLGSPTQVSCVTSAQTQPQPGKVRVNIPSLVSSMELVTSKLVSKYLHEDDKQNERSNNSDKDEPQTFQEALVRSVVNDDVLVEQGILSSSDKQKLFTDRPGINEHSIVNDRTSEKSKILQNVPSPGLCKTVDDESEQEQTTVVEQNEHRPELPQGTDIGKNITPASNNTKSSSNNTKSLSNNTKSLSKDTKSSSNNPKSLSNNPKSLSNNGKSSSPDIDLDYANTNTNSVSGKNHEADHNKDTPKGGSSEEGSKKGYTSSVCSLNYPNETIERAKNDNKINDDLVAPVSDVKPTVSVVQKDTINSKKPSMKLRLDSPPTLQLSDFSTDISPQLSPVMPILSPLDAPVGTNIFIKVTDTKLVDNEAKAEAIENLPKGVTNLSAFMCTSKRANTPPPMYSGPPKSPRSPRNSSPSRGDVYSATSIVQHVDVSKKDDKSKRSSQKKGQKQMMHLSPRDMKEVAQYKTSLRIPAQLIQGKTKFRKVASKKALKFEKVDKKCKSTEDDVNKHETDAKREGESKEHKKRSRRTKLVDRPKIDTTEFSIKFAKTFGKDSQKFLDKISEKLKPRMIEPGTPPKGMSSANTMTSPSSTSKLSETSMEDLENSITVGPSFMQGKGDASSIKPQEQVSNTLDSLSSSWPLKSSVSKEELKLSSSTNSSGAERNIWSSIRVQNRSRPPGKKYDKNKYKLSMKLDQEKRYSRWEQHVEKSIEKPVPNEHKNTQPDTEETNINDGSKEKSNESFKPGINIPTSRPGKSKSPRRLKGMSPLMRNVMQMRKDLQRQMSPQRFRSLREQSGGKSPRRAGSISKEDPNKSITGDDTAAVEPSGGDTSVDADNQADTDGNTRASYDSSNHSKRKHLSLDLSVIGRKFKSDKFSKPEVSPRDGSGSSPKSKGFILKSPKDQQSRLSPRSPMLSPRSPRISPRSPHLSPRSPRRLISSTKPGTPLSPSRLSPRSPKLSPRSPKLSPRSPKSRSPRFRRARAKRMLNELRNSAGFVPETKRRRRSTAESLFADPSELDREQRWLQRAMLQFSELESVPHSDCDSDGVSGHFAKEDPTTNEAHEEAIDNANTLPIAPRKRGRPFSNTSKKAAEIRKKAVIHSRNADAKAIHDKRLQNEDNGGKHYATSTHTGQKRRRSSSIYHKDSAYETSLEKEQSKLETLRRQRNERKLEILTEPLSVSPPKGLTSPSLKSPKRSPGRKKGSSKCRIADLTGRLRLHLDKRPVYLKSLQLKEKASSQSIDEIIEKVSSVQTQEEQDAPSEPQPSTSKEDPNISSTHYGNSGEHSNSDRHGNIGQHSNLEKHNNPEQQVISEHGFIRSSEQHIPVPARLKQINVNSSWGETVLHKAARLGHEDVTLYCLKTAYQDVNARDNAGYTPLHECCVAGQLTIAKYLIAYGANVNVSSQDGIRPIHDAVENDMIEIVRLLLSCGADPTLSTYSGRTPQKIAKTKKMKDFLKGYFADLNGCDKADKSIHWHFKYTKTDKHLSGFDIFDDVPSDPEEAENPLEEEGGMLFDFFDKPHIPSYSLKLPDQGLGNYILLEELINQLQLTNESFRKTYPDVSIYTISLDEMSQRTKHSPIMTKQLKDIPKQNSNLELVRLDARVNDILGVTTESVYELKPYVPPLKVEMKSEVKSEVFQPDQASGSKIETNDVPENVPIKTEVSEDGYASDRTEIYENDSLAANGGQLGSSGRECQKLNGGHDSEYDVSEQEISLDSDSDHDGEQSSNKVNKSSDSLILDSETGVLLPDEQPIERVSSSQVYEKQIEPNHHIYQRSNKSFVPGNSRQSDDHENIAVNEYKFKDTSKKNGSNNLCDTSNKTFGFDYSNSHSRTHKNTNAYDSQLPQSHVYGNAEAVPHLPQSHGYGNVSKADVSSKYNIPMTQQSVSSNMTEVVKHPSKHQDEPLDFTKTNSKLSEKARSVDKPRADLRQPGIQSGIPPGAKSSITTETRNTNQDMNVAGFMNAFVASTAQRSSANAPLYHNQNQPVGNHNNQIQQQQERYKQSEPLQSQSHPLGAHPALAHGFPKEEIPRSVKMMMKQYQQYKDHQQSMRTNDYLKQHLQNKERQAQLTEAHEAKRNTELQKQKEQYMDRTKQVLALQRQREILQRRVHHTEMVKQESLATERKLQAEFARNTSIHHAASIASHQSPVSYHSNLPVDSHHSQLAALNRRQSPMASSHPSSPLGSYGKPYPHSPMGSMHQGTLRPGHSQSPLGSLRPKSPIVPAHAQSTLGSLHAMSPMGPAHSQSPLDSIHRHSPMGSSLVPSPLTSHHRHSPMSALSSHAAPVRWPHGNQPIGMQNSTPDRSPHVLPRMPTLLHVPSPDLTLSGGSMHELHAQAVRDSGPQTMPKLELSHLTQGPYRATPTSQSPFTPQYGNHRSSPSAPHRYPEGQLGSQGNGSYGSYGSMGRPTYHQGHTPESDTQGKRYTYL